MRAALVLVALTGGCVLPDFDAAGRRCPCADGLTCNVATDRCVRVVNGDGGGGALDAALADLAGTGGDDTAQFNFEAGVQGWGAFEPGTLDPIPNLVIRTSTDAPFAGKSTLAVDFSPRNPLPSNDQRDVTVQLDSGAPLTAVTFHVKLPATGVNAIQCFLMNDASGGWEWSGGVVSGSQLERGTWMTFTIPPPRAGKAPRWAGVEVRLDPMGSGTIYVDSVRW